MNNRGEILLVWGIILIIFTTMGIYTVYSNSNSLYIGNIESNEYLDYFKCEDIAKQIPQEQIKVFKSQQEAINQGFNATKDCV